MGVGEILQKRGKEISEIEKKISFLTIRIEDSENREEIENLKKERNECYKKVRQLYGLYN